MCEECRNDETACIRLTVAQARPDQIRRLIEDILRMPPPRKGKAA